MPAGSLCCCCCSCCCCCCYRRRRRRRRLRHCCCCCWCCWCCCCWALCCCEQAIMISRMPGVLDPPCFQVKRAARLDLPFPELPSDAHTELPSWRTGLHSDWRLRLGPTLYSIHKVLTGHGPRASSFLCSAFTTGQQLAAGLVDADDGSSGCGETDLSNILPEQVWPSFGQALDFIYSEELQLNEENAVPLLRCADALQIRLLFLR
ncbi:unnamed protein product, partial [Polarella glacialis]